VDASPRRIALLSALAALLGLVGGGASWVLLRLIGLLTNAALLHRYGWELPSLRTFHPGPEVIAVAAAGALCVSLLAKWCPLIRGHGIPEAMEAILTRRSRISPKAAVAKPLSAAVAIGTGGPFGAEGPIIVTGGAIGSLTGQLLHVSAAERKILLASGAAAGMAATFGAPLASVVLAIELLLFEFSPRALVPLAVASSVAAGVHAAYAGPGPLFDVPAHAYTGLGHLPIFAVLGVACGLLAVVVCRGLFGVEHAFRRSTIPEFWQPVVGAIGFAVVGIAVPRAFGVGYDVINDVLASRLALGTVVALLLAKLVMWWIALGSGTSGGTLAPVLLIGSTFGAVFARGVTNLFPHIGLATAAIVLAAMAATFGASTYAPFTSIVFAFELTRDYDAILPLIVTVVLAYLVASMLLDHSLMTEKLARRGVHVPRFFVPDVLAGARVRDAMTEGANVAAGAACVDADESLLHALRRFVDDDVNELAVVDGGRVVGVITHADLLRVRNRMLAEETIEHGWLATRRRR
jgi:chloride channel protein, CIC family